MMKPLLDRALRLALIGGVAALLLGIINSFTAPVIKARTEEENNNALVELVPGSEIQESFQPDVSYIYYAHDIELSDGSSGMILELLAKGYNGDMTLLAAFLDNGELLNAKLMANNETAGFGKKAEDPHYMRIFIGRGNDKALPLRLDQVDDPDDVTGATITFNGLSQALYGGSQWVKGRDR